jgi:hypothetical protein
MMTAKLPRTSLVPLASGITLFLLWPQTAHAYLDPGTGSLVLSTLLGGVAGFLIIMKLAWGNVLTFFGLRKAANDDKGPDTDDVSGSEDRPPPQHSRPDEAPPHT